MDYTVQTAIELQTQEIKEHQWREFQRLVRARLEEIADLSNRLANAKRSLNEMSFEEFSVEL